MCLTRFSLRNRDASSNITENLIFIIPCLYINSKGPHIVMFMVTGNEHGDLSSNPG